MSTLFVIILVILVVLALLAATVLVMRHRSKAPLGAVGGEGVVGGGPFRLKVSDPEYTSMLAGEKTIEARLDRQPFSRLAAGDPIVVVRSRPKDDTSEYPGGRYKHDAEVVRVEKYKNLEALLKGEGVAKVYPGKTAAEAAARFGMYLPPGTSASDPVLAIELRAAKPGAKKPPKKGAAASFSTDEFSNDYTNYEL